MNEERESVNGGKDELPGQRDPARGWYPADAPERTDLSEWYRETASRPAEEDPNRAALAKKRRRRRNITIIVCTLVLICAAVFAAWQVLERVHVTAVREAADQSAALFPGFPGASGENDFDDYRDYFANYYTNSDEVSIPRAQPGADVTLALYPETGRELPLQDIYDIVSPAVVGITATRGGEPYSSGTGVIFTQDGYIITNAHIISGCDGVEVTFMDGTELGALLVGTDSASDIAVLKMEGRSFPIAYFGDSDTLRVGDEVAAIGNPLGAAYAGTMTNGIISAINRNVSNNGHSMTLLQTNAALNEGNSGGPLVNEFGQVIGITNMKIMGAFTYTVEGIGFAIPSRSVKETADQLIAQGFVSGHPSIGITAGPVGSEAMERYGLPAGVYVASVDENSDAAARGLRVGDIILKVNGTEVHTVADVNAIKDEFAVGDSLTLTVYRDGDTFDLDVVLVDSGILR